MSTNELLKKRVEKKKNMPHFRRQDSHKHVKVKGSYRSARGLHSKTRRNKRGKIKQVSSGYSSPASVKHLDAKTGLLPVRVASSRELSVIDKEKQIAVIASELGQKKRVMLLEDAKKRGVEVMNVKDVDAKIKSIQDEFRKRVEQKKAMETTKKKEEKKKEEKKEKAEEKKEGVKEPAEEEKKQIDKKELDKLLTKRE